MKTFKQFITEEETVKLKDLIEDKCRPFLDQSGKKGFLYRGIPDLKRGRGKMVDVLGHKYTSYTFDVRKDREPMNMPEELHKAIDKWFEDNFGFKARSQAIFCYGEANRGAISEYGENKCVVFPIGGFSYVWSPKIEDLFLDLSLTSFIRDARAGEDIDLEFLNEYLQSLNYTSADLAKAISTSHAEIMVNCDSYIALPYLSKFAGLTLFHQALDVPFD